MSSASFAARIVVLAMSTLAVSVALVSSLSSASNVTPVTEPLDLKRLAFALRAGAASSGLKAESSVEIGEPKDELAALRQHQPLASANHRYGSAVLPELGPGSSSSSLLLPAGRVIRLEEPVRQMLSASGRRALAVPAGARRFDQGQTADDEALLASSGGKLIGDKFVLPSDQERRQAEVEAAGMLLAASRLAQRRASGAAGRHRARNQYEAGEGDTRPADKFGKIVDFGEQARADGRDALLLKLRDQLANSNENYNHLALMSARRYQERQLALRQTREFQRRLASDGAGGSGGGGAGGEGGGGDDSEPEARQQRRASRMSAGGRATSGRRAANGRLVRARARADKNQAPVGDDEESGAYNELAEGDEDDGDDEARPERRSGARAPLERPSDADEFDEIDEADWAGAAPLRRSWPSGLTSEADERANESGVGGRLRGTSRAGARRQASQPAALDQPDEEIDSSMNAQRLALTSGAKRLTGAPSGRRRYGALTKRSDLDDQEQSLSLSSRDGQLGAVAAAISNLDSAASKQLQHNSADLHAAAGHHHGKHPHYYQYVEVPKKKTWKFGFKRGNHKHEIEKHEKGHKHKFHTTFHWHAKEKCKKKSKCKSVGKMVWDYKHHKKHHHHP